MFALFVMIKKSIKYFLSLVILLHCTGVTQLVSACSKDNSAFVTMMNMNEEETKKEKESKEDTECINDLRGKVAALAPNISFTEKQIYFSGSKSRVNHQFIIELPTPPPDFMA